MGFAQRIAVKEGMHEAQIYTLVQPKAKKRKIAWERVLLPVLLLGAIVVHRQNVAIEDRLQHDMQTVFNTIEP